LDITSFGYGTDIGASRSKNEDSFCVLPDIGLWAVADGMGGYQGGSTASQMTVERLADDVRKGVSLSESLSTIHHDILTAAGSDPEKEGMGSTAVVMKTDGRHYEIAWVGDSRAYLWNGNDLKQITRDHSYVQDLLDEGMIDEKDVIDHPQRHAITQALGAEGLEKVDVDVIYGIFYENEKILLCSDGLTGEVDDVQMASILSDENFPQAAIDRLIDAANSNGGSDNITAILISAPDDAGIKGFGEITEPIDTETLLIHHTKKHHPLAQWIIIIILFMIIIGLTVYLL
jgi:serine/threonine protein phosphatase PrpC